MTACEYTYDDLAEFPPDFAYLGRSVTAQRHATFGATGTIIVTVGDDEVVTALRPGRTLVLDEADDGAIAYTVASSVRADDEPEPEPEDEDEGEGDGPEPEPEPEPTMLACPDPECPRTFKNKLGLNSHVRARHPELT